MAKKVSNISVEASPKKSKLKKLLKNNVGFIYILPWLIGFLIFRLYPFISSLAYSFTDFQLFNGVSKVGLMNYEEIFASKKIMKAFGVTFKYAFITVPLKLIISLFIAYILNFKLKGVKLFRTAYYIPSILGGSVAIAVLWKAVFRDDGLLNTALEFFGVDGPQWLSDPSYALFIISLLRVWQFGSAMVIFLAALKAVPNDLYEAAAIDGAGKGRQFLSI
ncbi:MAG TPA: sugar ABC transporter permease, partial [Clostridiales bacterium]|nr:sugar ABC transporter permease [Clostridiales bacterium]